MYVKLNLGIKKGLRLFVLALVPIELIIYFPARRRQLISGCVLRYRRCHKLRTNPLKILEMLIAHQIPSKPRAVDESSSAPGILRRLKTMLTIEGGKLLP